MFASNETMYEFTSRGEAAQLAPLLVLTYYTNFIVYFEFKKVRTVNVQTNMRMAISIPLQHRHHLSSRTHIQGIKSFFPK